VVSTQMLSGINRYSEIDIVDYFWF